MRFWWLTIQTAPDAGVKKSDESRERMGFYWSLTPLGARRRPSEVGAAVLVFLLPRRYTSCRRSRRCPPEA